jgi:hypothetical protein
MKFNLPAPSSVEWYRPGVAGGGQNDRIFNRLKAKLTGGKDDSGTSYFKLHDRQLSSSDADKIIANMKQDEDGYPMLQTSSTSGEAEREYQEWIIDRYLPRVEEDPIEIEVVEVEPEPVVQMEATPAPPQQEEVVIRVEVPNLEAPKRIRLPKRSGVIRKTSRKAQEEKVPKVEIPDPWEDNPKKSLSAPKRIRRPRIKGTIPKNIQKRVSTAQRMAAAFDKNFLDKLVDSIRNPPSGPEPKKKSKKSGKTVYKKKYSGISSTKSTSGGDLVDKGFNRVKKAFGLAAKARREFKESGGNPKDLRRGWFLERTLASEFGGDRIRRTKGTFSRNPDESQDPALKREERLAAVLRRDMASRPEMMKQGELFDTGEYEDKTLGKRFLELSKEVADKILGIDSSFVRMDKAQKETNTKLNSVSKKLKSVKNVFVKTSSNVSEFIKNKSRSLELKEKLREIFKDDLNREEQREKEAESELQKDVADTTKVEAAGDNVSRPEEDGGGDGGGFDIDFRGSRKWWRRLRNPRRFFRTLRRYGRLKGGQFVRGAKSLGGKALRFGKGLASRAPGAIRGLGGRAPGVIRGLGGRALGMGARLGAGALGKAAALWAVTEGLFPRAGSTPTLDDVMDASGKLPGDPGYDKTTAGQAKPGSKPTSVKPDSPKPSSGFAKKADQAKDLGKNLAGKGRGLLSKGKGAIKKVGGKIVGKAGGALGKGLLKKIPGLSIIMGALFSIDRFANRDWLGGLGEIASGIASTFPGPGTAISAGIDALLLTKDILAPTPDKKGDTKLSGGGIIAGEAGNEVVHSLTSSVGRGVMDGLKSGASFLPVMGPTLSAASGIVSNPLYGRALGPLINPIIQPLISKYNIPTFAADLGSFKADRIKSATTQAQTKQNVSNQGKKKGGGILGGVVDFFKNLFGGGKNKNKSSGSNGPSLPGTGPATGNVINLNLSQREAYKKIYDLAVKVGGAKFPELVAAIAMHETGWLTQMAGNNPFNQRATSGNFINYNSLEDSVREHIKFWHNTDKYSDNFNAHPDANTAFAHLAYKYAPPEDNNDPEAYKRSVANIIQTMGGASSSTSSTSPSSAASAGSSATSAGPTSQHQGPVISATSSSSSPTTILKASTNNSSAPTPNALTPNVETAMNGGGGIQYVPVHIPVGQTIASTGEGVYSSSKGSGFGLTVSDLYNMKLQNT